jgi:hypothetical protein
MPWRQREGVQLWLSSFFNLSARWGWVANATTRPLYPQEGPSTHCTGGWVGPRADMDWCRKSFPHRGSNPKLSSLYTDYGIPAHVLLRLELMWSLNHLFNVGDGWCFSLNTNGRIKDGVSVPLQLFMSYQWGSIWCVKAFRHHMVPFLHQINFSIYSTIHAGSI